MPTDKRGKFGYGDVWTWVAIDSDTKLVPTYRIGARDFTDARIFIEDLARRLRNRIQLTTDGNHAYLNAVKQSFKGEIDYAMLVKVYGTDANSRKPEQRYLPSICLEAVPHRISGEPDPDHISTSHVERLHVWTLRELIGLLEEAESVPTKRGRYAKTRERRAAARDSD